MSDDAVKRDESGEVRDPSTGRFGPGNKGGGRPRIAPEVREMIRAATPKAVQKLIDQLEATKTIVIGAGKDAYSEEVEDGELQHKAAVVLAAYGIGKPIQSVAIGLEDEDGNAMRLGVVLLPATSAE